MASEFYADPAEAVAQLEQLHTDLDLLSSFDVDDITPEGLLFQSGYLTIAKVEEIFRP